MRSSSAALLHQPAELLIHEMNSRERGDSPTLIDAHNREPHPAAARKVATKHVRTGVRLCRN